ncbi:GNAT family N-acetyltransferase [Piscinibacter terrae]|uniref:N-acetyltransferase n=1 Tax=Piscinibacter terrae TaxID=2496871 RepID=A0A3N7HRJ2_9BURK|nr:GNAT family N-acetyltransferase [Albitalea terrae]RQP24814.1 N-acetyltransferase [Albitalea terrae]
MAHIIKHDTERSRFETTVDGQLCVADYRLVDKVMVMTHTFVPPPLEGRGIAAEMVEAAMDYARKNDLKVDPRCSYVAVYMRRHPETKALHV